MKTKTYTTCVYVLILVDFPKNSKKIVLILFWNANASIRNSSNQIIVIWIVIQTKFDAAFISEFKGILEEIYEYLLNS